VPWHPLRSTPPFAQNASSLWGGDVNWRTALATALWGQGFSATGSTGAVGFLPSGDRNATVQLVKVQPGTRSGTGFNLVPLP